MLVETSILYHRFGKEAVYAPLTDTNHHSRSAVPYGIAQIVTDRSDLTLLTNPAEAIRSSEIQSRRGNQTK